jgi:hypothetical protein
MTRPRIREALPRRAELIRERGSAVVESGAALGFVGDERSKEKSL